jgi:hypothetical protein
MVYYRIVKKNSYTPSNKNKQAVPIQTPSKNSLKLNLLQKLNDSKTIEDSETFNYEDDKPIELSNEERLIYGNREPVGYKRLKILGK